MNERIRELGIHAGLYVDLNGRPWPQAMSAEECEAAYKKFAELIVRECSKTVNDTEYPYEDPAHKETWDACCVWSAEKLKEHFGVE